MRAAAVQVGLRLLMEDRYVFSCHAHWASAVMFAELGSSGLMLRAGFNIASMMLRYHGLDWRDRTLWNCNGGCVRAGRAEGSRDRRCIG